VQVVVSTAWPISPEVRASGPATLPENHFTQLVLPIGQGICL